MTGSTTSKDINVIKFDTWAAISEEENASFEMHPVEICCEIAEKTLAFYHELLLLYMMPRLTP